VISLDDARQRILDAVAPLAPRPVALADALGLVLARDVVAAEMVPPFANTAMDGYAVRAADTANASDDAPATLRVVAELAAGVAPSVAVGPGDAIRIMTGAPMPAGADAVVMVERTRSSDASVDILQAAQAGDHVRPAGGDLEIGQHVFEAGHGSRLPTSACSPASTCARCRATRGRGSASVRPATSSWPTARSHPA
jgi:molybdopterin molybdotransferase